jgi:hypothetical protein
VLTAINAIGELSEEDAEILLHNRGHLDFSVASVMLYRRMAPTAVQQWFSQTGILRVPIKMWATSLKPFLDEAARYGVVPGLDMDDARMYAVETYLRKLMTLTGRDLTPADYLADLKNTRAGTAVHQAPLIHGNLLSADRWNELFADELQMLVSRVVEQILERADLLPIDMWWSQRWKWTPAGSSSLRHNLDGLRQLDNRLGSSDRPNKKATAETLGLLQLIGALTDNQTASLARMSTKPEPGYKRRVLYALDDMNAHISAYAATEMEKYMCVGGMVAKQTPQDVISWWRASMCHPPKWADSVWVSLDYSDFNKDHNKVDLACVELAFGKEWLKRARTAPGGIRRTALHKALASFRTGLGHLNAWAREATIGEVRTFSGLWSGHRTTSRDNTLLHKAYSATIQRVMYELFGMGCPLAYLGICGDDEDALHPDWTQAAAYLGLHSLCGFSLNPVKQKVDRRVHEFLQRTGNGMLPPTRPVANVLAALSTGSWYKDGRPGIDRNADELTRNLTELVNRGADTRLTRRLGMRLLNAMYAFTDEHGSLSLDWWPVRYGAKGGVGILWGSGVTAGMDFPKTELKLPTEAPTFATEDWVRSKEQWFNTDEMRLEYRTYCLRESYKGLYGKWLNKQEMAVYMTALGERTRERDGMVREEIRNLDGEDMQPCKQFMDCLVHAVANQSSSRRSLTLAEVLTRMGADMVIFGMLGGWPGVFERAEHSQTKKFEKTFERVPYPTHEQRELMKYDGAVASWASTLHMQR